jgi:hypothetical protein
MEPMEPMENPITIRRQLPYLVKRYGRDMEI